MYHIYNKKGQYEYTVYDLSNEDKEQLKETHFILDTLIEFPKLQGNEIVSMSEEEIQEFKYKQYQKQEYNLAYNEILQDNKVVAVDLKEYEYIEQGILKFNYDKKREDLKEKLRVLKHKVGEEGYILEGILRQPCREQDKTSITSVEYAIEKYKLPTMSWKFFHKDTGQHIYKELNYQELEKIGVIIMATINASMVVESNLIEKINNLSQEQLKEYKDIETEYRTIFDKTRQAMITKLEKVVGDK